MFKKSILIVFLLGLSGSFVNAQVDPMNLPKLTEYVSDFSHVIPNDQLIFLNAKADAYERQTSNQLLAVLFPNRNGQEMFTIGMNIFTQNTIGQQGKNNGLLLLISTEEKKIRIVVGYGLESQIPDVLASRMIEQDIRPLVDNGDFSGAVNAFYTKAIEYINDTTGGNGRTVADANQDYLPIAAALGFVFGIIMAIIAKLFVRKGPTKVSSLVVIVYFVLLAIAFFLGIALLLYFLIAILFAFGLVFSPKTGGGGFFGGGGFSSGGGSFGGGGFSGGGGSSGGGGAGD